MSNQTQHHAASPSYPENFILSDKQWEDLTSEASLKPAARKIIERAIAIYLYWEKKLQRLPPAYETKASLKKSSNLADKLLTSFDLRGFTYRAITNLPAESISLPRIEAHQRFMSHVKNIQDVKSLIQLALKTLPPSKRGSDSANLDALVADLATVWKKYHPAKKKVDLSSNHGGFRYFLEAVFAIAAPNLGKSAANTALRKFLMPKSIKT